MVQHIADFMLPVKECSFSFMFCFSFSLFFAWGRHMPCRQPSFNIRVVNPVKYLARE